MRSNSSFLYEIPPSGSQGPFVFFTIMMAVSIQEGTNAHNSIWQPYDGLASHP